MLSEEIEPPIVPVPIMNVRSTPVEYPMAPNSDGRVDEHAVGRRGLGDSAR